MDEESNLEFYQGHIRRKSEEYTSNFSLNVIPPRITISSDHLNHQRVLTNTTCSHSKEDFDADDDELDDGSGEVVEKSCINSGVKCNKCHRINNMTLPIIKPFRDWVRQSIVDEFSGGSRKCKNHHEILNEEIPQAQENNGSEDGGDCEFLTRMHLAAKNGDSDELEELISKGENPNPRDCSGRTPLHLICILECNAETCLNNALKCLDILLSHPTCELNAQDIFGETALHMAAESQFTKAVSKLIYKGANVHIKSNRGTRALTLIVEKVPMALSCIMNKAITTTNKYDTNNIKCEVKLDFGPLIGYSSDTRNGGMSFKHNHGASSPPSTSGNSGELADGLINGPNNNGGIGIMNNNSFNPRRETQLLNYILNASSASRNKILTHPAISAFLTLKWRRVRPFFLTNLLFQTILLLLYTFYILDVYLINCPYRPKITEPAAVKAAKAQGLILNENDTYIHEYIKFTWFGFKPEIKEIPEETKSILQGNECHLEIGPTVKSIFLLVLTILANVFEVFKMLPATRDYWRRKVNKMLWSLFFFIYLTCWPAFMSYPNITFWQYQASAFGLFLGWILMLLHIGKFPVLGIYVDILGQVLRNFGFFMLTYASLLIAFALAFCVLFPGNAPYASVPLAILKVLIQMVGEVNYEELFYGNEDSPVDDLVYPFTGHILYAIFVVMITIVLMNLLVGLTVSDITGLRKDAQLAKITCQISEIYQLESFIFSKKVSKIIPNKITSFVQNRISIARDGWLNKEKEKNKEKDKELSKPFFYPSNNESYLDNCVFIFKPNDATDKTFHEDLKMALLKLASTSHQKKRASKCLHNLINLKDDKNVTTPIYEELPSFRLHPPPFLTQESIISNSNANRHSTHFNPYGYGYNNPPPQNICPSNSNNPISAKTGQELELMFKRLEDKIMNRMKLQMDTLYQKLEEKLLEQEK